MGIGMKQDQLVFYSKQHKEEVLMTAHELALPGIHNTYNSMAAALAARYFEIPNQIIRDSLMSFKSVEHRLEAVRTIGGVTFVNDSKATNINSTWYALQSYDNPIVWIAGGRGDNNDYSILDKYVEENVTHIITIGEETETIFNHFCLSKPCTRAESLEDAVTKAFQVAENKDIILFSPACKSFDMFNSYEHRGKVFKEIVNNLK
jgi:UDP-N-acetylmuramoylalanine--D-glutamate ligase